MGQSGKQLSEKYMQALQSYLASVTQFPTNVDGTMNVSKIAKEAGVPRQSLYKNPKMKAALEEAKKSCGFTPRCCSKKRSPHASTRKGKKVSAKEDSQATGMQRRIEKLEKQNVVLMAENSDLRKQVVELRLQLSREEMVVETGRRIPPPFDHE